MEEEMSQSLFRNPTLTVHRTAKPFARHPAARFSITQSALAATIRLWIARSRERRHLAELAQWNDHMLRDIGVSRVATLHEAAKPFWQK
jgi:uncharacterized protein YjiS (DUF1127 family)